MPQRTNRPATQRLAEALTKAPSTSLDIHDMKNWGGAATSDWAKQEAEWAQKAHNQGYSHFKSPREVGVKSEVTANKRYFPTLNKKGEWEQKDRGPLIHRTTHTLNGTPTETPEDLSKTYVATEDRAAFNKDLKKQTTHYDEAAPKRLTRPVERRECVPKKRATVIVKPTRKRGHFRTQPNLDNVPAVGSTELPRAGQNNDSASVPINTPTLYQTNALPGVQAEVPVAVQIGDPAVMEASAPTLASSSTPAVQAKATQGQPSPTAISDIDMVLSNGTASKNEAEKPVPPVAVLEGSHSGASTNASGNQKLLVTWKMGAALAFKMQSLLSHAASTKHDDDSIRPKVTVKTVTGSKRKAEEESSVSGKRTRVKLACEGCRQWRVKCDGNNPCESCVGRKKDCTYEKVNKKQDDKGDAPTAAGLSKFKSAAKLASDKPGPSGTKKRSAARTARNKTANSTGDTSLPTRSCKMCRIKKTGCDRQKPCQICKEREWTCIYDEQTLPDQHKKPEASGSGGPGRKPSGSDKKKSIDTSASPKKVDGPAKEVTNPKCQRKDDQSDHTNESAAHKSKTGLDWELRLIPYNNGKTRTILPAISEWTVKGEDQFQDFQFDITQWLTKRQMEKQKMVPEVIKRDLSKRHLAIFETATNHQRSQEEIFHSRPSIKLVLPDHLKGFLVDDWENVTKNGQLVELPHSKATVDQILRDYVEYEKQHRQEGSTHMDILVETTEGIREYFDKALARILLYRQVAYDYHVILHSRLTSTSDSSVCSGPRYQRIGLPSRALAPPTAPNTSAGCLVRFSFYHLPIAIH